MDNEQEYKPLKHLCWPFTPYKLFSPVTTVFEDAMTYEEQLLGLYKLYNDFIEEYNKIIGTIQELQQLVDTLPDQFNDLEEAFKTLEQDISRQLLALASAINEGDKNTLKSANDYTDEQVSKIKPSGAVTYGITAEQYDALRITASSYDGLNITAREYDEQARIIFFGDAHTIYLQFVANKTFTSNETVFDLVGPPLTLGRKYQIEISLGTFSLNGGEPAHLEIVGRNTLGNTLPITVPNGGSATVCGIFNELPTQVRAMSDQTEITAYNAYIRIKPLGEA